MADVKDNRRISCWIAPVRVLACLRTNWLTVVAFPGVGLADGGAHFFIPGLPADFNRIGSELMAWLSDTTRPFRIEWRDEV